MKNYLDLISVFNTNGLLDSELSSETYGPVSTRDGMAGTIADLLEDELASCQPLVFEPDTVKKELHGNDYIDQDLDAPFRCFSIEASVGALINIKHNGPEREDGDDILLWCLLCVEYAPKEFATFALLSTKQLPNRKIVVLSRDYEEVAKIYIKRMNSEATGVESVNRSVKVRSRTGKKQFRIRRVVHVMPKKIARARQSESGNRIDFSHRFFVRGHWRNLPDGRIGKDRAGDYCVQGFTWVIPFEKGPEGSPPISKVRIVSHPE